MQLFDTHAHLDQPEFDDDRAEVIARAAAAGVENIIAIGISADTSAGVRSSWRPSIDGVHAAVGMQPNYLAEAKPGDWDRVVAMVDEPGVVAIGETGLDRYWDFTPFDVQQDYFDRHMRLSQERGLPFIVHMRDCDEDILVMLREARAARAAERRDALVHGQPGDGGGMPGDGPLHQLRRHGDVQEIGRAASDRRRACRTTASSSRPTARICRPSRSARSSATSRPTCAHTAALPGRSSRHNARGVRRANHGERQAVVS